MKKLCLLFAALVLLCSIAVPVMAAQGSAPVYIAGSTYYDPAESANLRLILIDSVDGQAAHQKYSKAAADHHTQEKPEKSHYKLIPSIAVSPLTAANLISNPKSTSSVALSV